MRKSGITSTTPNDFLLNAGVVFKNFAWVWRKAAETATSKIEIVADDAEETETTIRLSKVANPGVSFIKLAADYTEPKVGDFIVGAWDDAAENVLGATSGGNKLKWMAHL